MTKWGVRLIACYFFVWAISDFYGLVTSTRTAKGFLSFDLGLTYNGEHIDVIAWLGVAILLYAGFQLLRFHPSGYDLTLLIFWLSFFSLGFSLVWLVIWLNSDSVDLSNVVTIVGIKGTILAQLLVAAFFVLHSSVLYFLYRKDTKALFNIPAISREIN